MCENCMGHICTNKELSDGSDGIGELRAAAMSAAPPERRKMQLKNATVLHKSAGKAPKVAHKQNQQTCEQQQQQQQQRGQELRVRTDKHGHKRAVNMANIRGLCGKQTR